MAGFWAGFGTELATNIKERDTFVREETDRRQDYLMRTGLPARMKIQQQMESDLSVIKDAQALGFSERTATALYNAGQLDSAMGVLTSGNAPADYVNTVVTFAQDNAGELSAEEAVKRAYAAGLGGNINANEPEGQRQGFFEAMFSLNPQKAVEQSMAGFDIGGIGQAELTAAIGFAGPSRTAVAGARYNPTAGYSMDQSEERRARTMVGNVIASYIPEGLFTQNNSMGYTVTLFDSDNAGQLQTLESRAVAAYDRLRRVGVDGKGVGLSHGEANAVINEVLSQNQIEDGTNLDLAAAGSAFDVIGIRSAEGGTEAEVPDGAASTDIAASASVPEVQTGPLPSVEEVAQAAEDAILESELSASLEEAYKIGSDFKASRRRNIDPVVREAVEKEREKRKDSLNEEELELHLEKYESAIRGNRPVEKEEDSTQKPDSNTAGFDTSVLDAIR